MRTIVLATLLSVTSGYQFAAAASLTCPAQHPQAEKKLIGVTLYDEKDKTQYELAPSSDKQQGNMVKQTWDGFTSETDVKTFVRCRYLNTEETVTLEIPKTLKRCDFHFTQPGKKTTKETATFECK